MQSWSVFVWYRYYDFKYECSIPVKRISTVGNMRKKFRLFIYLNIFARYYLQIYKCWAYNQAASAANSNSFAL